MPKLPMKLPRSDSPFTWTQRQATLDAGARLLACRNDWAARLAAGERQGGRIVAVGDVDETLYQESFTWRTALAANIAQGAYVVAEMPHTLALEDAGLEFTGIYDAEHLDSSGRDVVRAMRHPSLRFGLVPVRMKIINGREVLLQGPEVDGAQSVMAVSDAKALAVAYAYWHVVLDASHLAMAGDPGVNDELTDRQRLIVGLLRQDHTDETIARRLGVSVRTVRGDIASLMDRVGARSRFAAAHRLARSDGAPTPR